MSHEYQPNEVVESQPEPEAMPAAGAPAAGTSAASVPDVQSTAGGAGVGAATVQLADSPVMGVATKPTAQIDSVVAGDRGGEAPREVRFDLPGSATGGAAGASVRQAAPTLMSIAEIERPRRARRERTGPSLGGIGTYLKGRGWIAAAVLAVLVMVFLFLPPISLAQRLSTGAGYTRLDAEDAVVTHPDGLTIKRAQETPGGLRVKLGSIPRADFVAGVVPDALRGAVAAIPSYLVPKSPCYTIDLKARDVVPGEMRIVVPNEAEPWETLDLYAWDGQAWKWLPTRLDRDAEVLVSTVAALPATVIVMQSSASIRIVAEVEQGTLTDVDPAIEEVNVPGVLIGTMGGVSGYVDDLPVATAAGEAVLVPTVRNWLPEHEANWALVSDMLNVAADRSAHVANLVALAQDGKYPGMVIDYRGAQPQDRESFTAFAQELGAVFSQAGLGSAVVVDTPVRATDGTWDTGGYDWEALGAAVDQLRVVMPLEPSAYVPGGDAEQLIAWAVTQLDRHKLLPVYTTLSTDGDKVVLLSSILGEVGPIQVGQPLTESVAPGTIIHLSLGTRITVEPDAETRGTRVAVGDKSYWLGTPEWLEARMDLSARYQLGGIVLRDLLDPGNVTTLVPALAAYQASGDVGSYALPDVIWQISSPTGQNVQVNTRVSQPDLTWTAPDVTGTYHIAATLGGLDKGVLDVTVAAPAPVVTDTLTADDAEPADDVEPEAEPVEETDPTLAAGFVADVSVPDNTRFEQGEEFVKTWRLRNSGTADWPADTVLVFAAGADLGKSKEVAVGEVKSGDNVDINAEMIAPKEDGRYRSTWELRTGGKAIRGGGAYVLIQVGEEPEAPLAETPVTAPVVAPRPVAGGAFELGGHIRDLGMPYANQMHYSGMNWVKIQVHYGEGASGIIAAAHAGGFKIQLSAIGGASMTAEPGFEDKFASWVAGLAAAGADAIEVWNEPNIDREWQIGLISPQAYTNLLCKSYNADQGCQWGNRL